MNAKQTSYRLIVFGTLILLIFMAGTGSPDGMLAQGDANDVFLPLVTGNFPMIETGKIVFVSNRDGNSEIYKMEYDGSHQVRLTNNAAEDLSPDWSPDGSKIAFISYRSGEGEIYVMNADGSNQLQITTLTQCGSPQWSPDGTRIAFYSRQNNNNIIYTMNPDGSGLTPVTEPSISAYDPYWSPDGTRIAFMSSRITPGVHAVNTDGSNETLLVPLDGIAYFAWSPGGNRFALSKTTPSYNFDLYVYDLATSCLKHLTNTQYNHNSVDWSPMGTQLVFHSNREDISNFEIYSMPAMGGQVVNLSNNPAADSDPDWTK
jgi:Tol biopolymer transport system component